MFEKWAIAFADQIKKANPEETAPQDVLVFGFTIIFNLLFTLLLVMVAGWLLDATFIILQIGISFMILRILSGGAHLNQSLTCSIASLLLMVALLWLPQKDIYVYSYWFISLLLILKFAPYYEEHQLKHSAQWERKKKAFALVWLLISLLFSVYFGQTGFVSGALLQAVLLTPMGIKSIHTLDHIVSKFSQGGEKGEKTS
ncbi:accessory gene regulator B family protein [Lederbergia sp. NSJ-179]|uniref:accessory gene regulator ArgB-like protein n=1 Tax=Lederbergia sp. NSJ-179 TaxID=2931402 RepID=UPI001FD5E137|nr:accessory gene regulator B family protein [Lederbergia sp. NSJ-179]MCJ7842446.1 accessory gene regulator B family protein [Lederbergia sp. NSJ-179]